MTDRYLFRGFYPCENGTESVWIEGKEIKGKWIESKSISQIDSTNEVFLFDRDTLMLRNVIPETVGMYTGLTDKHGRRIFEGDIFEHVLGVTCYRTPKKNWRKTMSRNYEGKCPGCGFVDNKKHMLPLYYGASRYATPKILCYMCPPCHEIAKEELGRFLLPFVEKEDRPHA